MNTRETRSTKAAQATLEEDYEGEEAEMSTKKTTHKKPPASTAYQSDPESPEGDNITDLGEDELVLTYEPEYHVLSEDETQKTPGKKAVPTKKKKRRDGEKGGKKGAELLHSTLCVFVCLM